MTKDVHVNAYTRSDGTEVKEHYRSAPSDSSVDGPTETYQEGAPVDAEAADELQIPQDGILKGRISYNVYPKAPEEKSIDIKEVLEKAKQISVLLAKDSIIHSDNIVNTLELAKTIDLLENGHRTYIQKAQQLLNYIIGTIDKIEYQAAYKQYAKLHEINTNNANVLNRIKYSNSIGDYETLAKDLQNFNSDFDKVVKRNKMERPIFKEIAPYPLNNRFNIPFVAGYLVDIGSPAYSALFYQNKLYDFINMWAAASGDFTYSRNYIKNNGNLVYSVSDLPDPNFQNIVRDKLRKSNMSDSIGIIYNSESFLSQQIVYSDEFRYYFLKNKENLLKGNVVKNQSTYLGKDKNLAYSLGHVDIPYTFIDHDGTLNSLILDVYDFDSNTKNGGVLLAKIAQDFGYARKYYSINIIKIPRTIWGTW